MGQHNKITHFSQAILYYKTQKDVGKLAKIQLKTL